MTCTIYILTPTDILFIVECKAINLSWEFFRGDSKAIEFRTSKIKKALNQADKTLNFVHENFTNGKIELPDRVGYVCSILITPHPEFIWELSDDLFISNDLPRIITLKELNILKKEAILDNVRNSLFTKKIVKTD